jgi:PleD family two-component response regulator
MKYILDFDEVLFNTTALKKKMADLDIPETSRSPEVLQRITTLDTSFTVESLIFPGAQKFLSEHGADCIIVSSATSETLANNTNLEEQLAFQMDKITRSGVKELAAAVYIVGSSKRETLQGIQNLLEEQGDDMVFMDDRERYVRESHSLGIKSILMDRSCQKDLESSEFPRICSFAEFAELVEGWK